MSDAGSNDAILAGALKDLRKHWEESGWSWRDAARDRFDKEFLQDLTAAVLSASNAVGQIEALLRQVRKECA